MGIYKHIGTLTKGLDDAPKYGCKLIDMKSDWNRIYPFDPLKQ